MSDPTAAPQVPALVDTNSRPRLPRGVRLKHDELRGEWVLLAPERMMKLNPVSVEILKRCDGTATLAEIVADLARAFAAPAEQIERDVTTMLSELVRKRLVDL